MLHYIFAMPSLLCQFCHCVLLYTIREHPGVTMWMLWLHNSNKIRCCPKKICWLLLEPFSRSCSRIHHLGPHTSAYPQCSAVTLDMLWINPGSTLHAQMKELQYSKGWKTLEKNWVLVSLQRPDFPSYHQGMLADWAYPPILSPVSNSIVCQESL